LTDVTKRPGRGLLVAAAVLATALGALLWLSLLMGPYRLASGMLDARAHLNEAEKAIGDGRLRHARYRSLAARAAVSRAEDGLRSGGPLMDLARLSNTVDDILGEVPHLVAAARHSADALGGAMDVALGALRGPRPVIARDPEGDGSRIDIGRIRELGEVITSARGEVGAARRELEAVDEDKLPGRLAREVSRGIARAAETDATLADAEAGFALLPRFLGADGPRTYLLAMQNSAELRGTGGAILQFALLTLTDGKPGLIEGGTVYHIDEDRVQVPIPLPDDAWLVRGIPDAQRFGNANWSPHWPLSARLTLDYARARDPNVPDVDGVIAVDPVAMSKLLPGTGPYTIPAGNRITSRRVVHFLLYRAYASYPITPIRRAILRQVIDGFYDGLLDPNVPTELARGMGDALAEKNMQIWLSDHEEQAFLEAMGWDGAIEDARNRDYLYVVQQNVGGNKLDYFASNRIEVDVRLDRRDALVNTTIGVHNEVFLPQPRWSMGDSGPLHRPMINLYAREDAELLGVEAPAVCVSGAFHDSACRLNSPAPAVWTGERPATHFESGKQVWSATLQIPAQQDGEIRFDYRAPGVVQEKGNRSVYRLVVQRQPRAHADDLIVRLRLPEGATKVKAPGFDRRGDMLVWERPLQLDSVLEVSWRR
jgi:hypothetical protein